MSEWCGRSGVERLRPIPIIQKMLVPRLMKTFIIFLLISGSPFGLLAESATNNVEVGQKSFKGWELYSWKNTTSSAWNFSLLQGTNRRKTEAEIKSPEVIKDTSAIKAQLQNLAPHEHVSWFINEIDGLEYPPQDVVDDLMKTGLNRGLKIVK